MKYVSTRGESAPTTASEAIRAGLAPDGGLYVPERFPRFDAGAFDGARDIADVAHRLLEPFFAGDELAPHLAAICREALDFPAPLRRLHDGTSVLELFHGPTAAFKDFGARFLAAAMARLTAPADPRPYTVLVATSGDTGGAVAAAFAGRPGFEVVVLYPKGMVSDRQESQLTCWGGNVRALRVTADFDACQRLVKEAFADAELRETRRLTSANSINLGRLLPQMAYFADASLRYLRERGTAPGFIVPSGNLGNATAGFWALRSGLPVREIVVATNANPGITRFLAGEPWQAAPSIATLATAMDVGNPSNLERLVHLFGGWDQARAALHGELVEDDEIRYRIRSGPDDWGEVWDPHTAVAVAARERITSSDWILVATAHPAKFESVVEPLVGREVPVPEALAKLLRRPRSFVEVPPDLGHVKAALGAPRPG